MRFTLAVLGAGLTGTSLLLQLVESLRRAASAGAAIPDGVRFEVFDRHADFGPGLPHNPEYVLPFHITNMCARDMGIRADAPEDFQRWVNDNRSALAASHPELMPHGVESAPERDGCCHYPRALMGEYLRARFADAVRLARALGITVALHPRTEVVDLDEEATGIRIVAQRLDDRTTFTREADRVLLATGHWFAPSDHAQLFPSPWPAETLRREIPPGTDVGVIGSSLSAIETVLTLTSAGRFFRDAAGALDFAPPPRQGRVTLYSRNGLLPKVRGRIGARRNRVLTGSALHDLVAEHPGRLRLEPVFALLDAELRLAYGEPFDWGRVCAPQSLAEERLRRDLDEAAAGDGPAGESVWQTVLAELLRHARMLYLNLDPVERVRFDRDYTTLFFMHAASQPAVNAEKLLALMRRGVVATRRLDRGYRLEKRPESGGLVFHFRDEAGVELHTHHAYVVDARGQSPDYTSNPAPLARKLCHSGKVALTRDGHAGIRIDPATHRVQRASATGVSESSRRLYAVGAMTRGQMIDASMARGLVVSTARVAEDFVAGILGSQG